MVEATKYLRDFLILRLNSLAILGYNRHGNDQHTTMSVSGVAVCIEEATAVVHRIIEENIVILHSIFTSLNGARLMQPSIDRVATKWKIQKWTECGLTSLTKVVGVLSGTVGMVRPCGHCDVIPGRVSKR